MDEINDPALAALNPTLVRRQAAARLFELIDEVGQEAEAQKQQKQQLLQSALEGYRSKIDLTPTAGFLDSLYGTKLAPALQQQAQLGDKEEARIMGLQEELANAPTRRATEANALARLADGGDENKQGAIDRRAGDARVQAFEQTIQKDFNDELFTPAEEKKKQFTDVEAALNSGDYKSVTAMLPQIARGLGQTGVLTDRDVALVFPQTVATKLADVEAYLSGKATPPPELKRYMQALIARGRANYAQQFEEQKRRKLELYKNRTTSKKFGVFAPGGFGEVVKDQAETTIENLRGAAAPQAQTPAERLAELRAKKAAAGQ